MYASLKRHTANNLSNCHGTVHTISFQPIKSHCNLKRNNNRKTLKAACGTGIVVGIVTGYG